MGLSTCLSVCPSVAKTGTQKRDFFQKLSNLELWSVLTTYRKSYNNRLFKEPIIGHPPYCKSINHHISMKNCPMSMKFVTQQHISNSMTVRSPNMNIFKTEHGGRPPYYRSWNRRISTKKLSDIDESWYTPAHLELDDSKMAKYEHLKIQNGGRPPFKNRFLAITHFHCPISISHGEAVCS